jgi:hypothetical protein
MTQTFEISIFSPVPKSPSHTRLICVKKPLLNISCLGPLKSFPPCYSQSPLQTDFNPPPPPPPEQQLFETGLYSVNILYGNLKSENSQETSTKVYVHEFGFRANASSCLLDAAHSQFFLKSMFLHVIRR